jgi:predicted enzyme related to lactoylglutathione lyase
MQLSHLVLRAVEPERLAGFYEALGLAFHPEKHGNGPEHVSAELGVGVLEIYPLKEGQPPTTGLRLGFVVPDLRAACIAATAAAGRLVSQPVSTSWGPCATIRDPEGHLVDLVQASSY